MPTTFSWPIERPSAGQQTTSVIPARGELGTGISALPDLSFTSKTGRANLGEALARRLQTRRSSLFYAPDYGTDVREWLGESFDEALLGEMKSAVESECEKDPRVVSAEASLSYDVTAQTLTVALQITDADGPFVLILAATAVSVDVLRAP